MIKAGTIIEGPVDQAYEVTADLHAGMTLMVGHLRPIGNAPEPKAGEVMPYWLARYFEQNFSAEANDRG